MCQPPFFPLSLAATWGPAVRPHGFTPILQRPPLLQPLAPILARATPITSVWVASGCPTPPLYWGRHLRARGARFCSVADRFRPDSRVLTTMPIQPLPAWLPLSKMPQPPASWRTAIARGHRCRASPPRHSGQACKDKTPARAIPSTSPPRRWSHLLPLCPSLASLPSAVSACARCNPALRAHVPRLPNRPILPYHVCVCPWTGAVHRCARHHVQPPPPSQAQAARAWCCVPFVRSWHCLCSPRYASTPALLRACMRSPHLCTRVHGSALLRQAPRRCQAVPSVAPRAQV
jgi:hypothetical protein